MSDVYEDTVDATEELDGMVSVAEEEVEIEETNADDLIGEVVADEQAAPPSRALLDPAVKSKIQSHIENMAENSSLTFKPELRKYVNPIASKLRKATGKKYPTQTKKNADGTDAGVQIWNI